MYEDWPHSTIYLSATVSSFWKWSEGGQEISWADGPTIAFLPELSAVLKRLALDGLPPLGSVLLLMAACRNNWSTSRSRRELLTSVLETEKSTGSQELLWEVCNGLDRVHVLPSDLRQSIEAKAELAVLVFANVRGRLNREISQSVVESLDRDVSADLVRPEQAVTLGYWLLRDFGALREGLRRVNADALRLLIDTGLETLPVPAAVEPPPLTGTAWLAWLEDQQEFAGLARLARRLMAVIHIPRNLHDADELPVGGVTDIAPRGPLDRLLLSELAHDDLTLAVRVAMNEALYYRRESPPKMPPRQRHVLIDSGLRSWGLPRLYGAAVALAMTARRDKQIEVVGHRANGADLTPVVMNSPEGLREHLAALDHRLHPGESLAALAELLKQDDGGDAVIVAAMDTIADPEFQLAVDQRLGGTVYLAAVDRDGRFELQQHTRAGRKTLSKAQLPLDEILNGRPAAANLRDPSRGDLPAIFAMQTFPLLLPARVTYENSWYLDGWGTLTLAADGRLLRWTKQGQGAQQLATGLPPGRIHGVSSAGSDGIPMCAVVGTLSKRGLHAIWISDEGDVERRVPLLSNQEYVLGVAVDTHHAFVVASECVEAVNLKTGQASTVPLPCRSQDVHGLYVWGTIEQPGGAAWGWSRLKATDSFVERVSVLAWKLPSQVVRVFDVVGVEGPVAVTARGEIHWTALGTQKQILPADFNRPFFVDQVSRNGRRFSAKRAGETLIVHTLNAASHVTQDIAAQLEPEISQLTRESPLRHRFMGIGFTADGQLALISPKRMAWTLRNESLSFSNLETRTIAFAWQDFQPDEHEDVTGFTLRRARFADGSQAVLDSRGLLHLISSDKALPQCSIVLREGFSAGWCSDGRVWGGSYFIGDQSATDPRVIAREIIQPFVERAR